MRVFSNIGELKPDTPSIVTVGTYDGIHRGHVELLEIVRQMGKKFDLASTVVTFDRHPREVLMGKAISLLTSTEERIARCRDLGLDQFISIPFDKEISVSQWIRICP